MAKILKWIMHEILNVLPAVIFFFVAFSVINFTTDLMVKKEGITIARLPTIAIGALIVGKVLLVIDNLPFINAFSNKPLIYNTLWKTFVYTLGALAFRFAELLVPLISTHGNLPTAYEHFLNESDWPRFWAVQIWVALLFFFFALSRELTRAIGADRMRRMFFGG